MKGTAQALVKVFGEVCQVRDADRQNRIGLERVVEAAFPLFQKLELGHHAQTL
jgi:hypothetical protein